jgi:hypothetical protein
MIGTVRGAIRSFRKEHQLPAAAKEEKKRDKAGIIFADPGPDAAIAASLDWLREAQDESSTRDGGVARDFSLVRGGWSSSYPETTGYIIPTVLEHAGATNNADLGDRARRMLDWFVSIQLPSGGFQGGRITDRPVVPVTFNTGQILMGLAAGARTFGDVYLECMNRAAIWLVETQDADGCWRKHPSPFAAPGEKAYDTHVAWGLLEAARIQPASRFADGALANIRWALKSQTANGWFSKCCLNEPAAPLTHTLGYVLRGVVEGYLFSRDKDLLEASKRTAEGLISALDRETGYLPARLRADWSAAANYACLTGSVQIGICWLLLYRETGETKYRTAAQAVNRYVRRRVRVDGPREIRGAVKGSYPVSGDYPASADYCAYEYPNWACKFFIDSNTLERSSL